HFGGFPADERTVRLPAAGRNAGDHARRHFRREFSAREVVEEEQRLSALHHEIVDRHGYEVDADRVVTAGLDRDLDLGADAGGGGDENRIGISGPLDVEYATEPADFRVRAGPGGGAHEGLDQFDQPIARVNVDTGFRIGQAVGLVHCS